MGKKITESALVPVEIILTKAQMDELTAAFGGKDAAEAILNLLYMGNPPENLKEMTQILPFKDSKKEQSHEK